MSPMAVPLLATRDTCTDDTSHSKSVVQALHNCTVLDVCTDSIEFPMLPAYTTTIPAAVNPGYQAVISLIIQMSIFINTFIPVEVQNTQEICLHQYNVKIYSHNDEIKSPVIYSVSRDCDVMTYVYDNVKYNNVKYICMQGYCISTLSGLKILINFLIAGCILCL